MEKIKKVDEVECDRDNCPNYAATKIETSTGEPLKLCKQHEEKFAEKLRQQIEEKYGDMDEDEIAQKIVKQGESLL